MAGRLLGRVGAREREMRRLVAHDRPQLVLTGPVREDPDDLGPVCGVRALEAVAKPKRGGETTVSTKAMSACGTPSSRQASASAVNAAST